MKSKTFWLIVLVCVSPILLSNLLYYWMPLSIEADTHGELLPQAIPLEDFSASEVIAAERFDRSSLQGDWRLLIVENLNDCNQACEAEIVQMRQLRLALGEDLQRVQNTIVLTEPMNSTAKEKFLPAIPHFDILEDADALIAQIQSGFGIEPYKGGVFLIDPNGNLVMRYPLGDGPEGKTEDLRHLLKYNQLG